jgi:hypothetical protein
MLKYKWSDILLLPGLWLELAAADVRLRLLHHCFNRGLLFPDPCEEEQAQQSLDARTEKAIDRLSHLVAVASRFQGPFNFSCLRQALVLRSRLRALGVAAKLVYGVRKDNAGLSAHAWIAAGSKTIYSLPGMKPLEIIKLNSTTASLLKAKHPII